MMDHIPSYDEVAGAGKIVLVEGFTLDELREFKDLLMKLNESEPQLLLLIDVYKTPLPKMDLRLRKALQREVS